MTGGHASEADRELLDALAAGGVRLRGRPIGIDQLQTWRQRGLIDGVDVASKGRGGRTSSYGPDAYEQVEVLVKILGTDRRLRPAALMVFGLGRNPEEAFLRKSFEWLILRTEQEAQRTLDDPDHLNSAVRAVFAAKNPLSALAKYALARSNEPAFETDEVTMQIKSISTRRKQQKAVADIASVRLAGSASSLEAALTLGVDIYLTDSTNFTHDEVLDGLDEQRMASPSDMRAFLQKTSYEELIRNRDLLRIILAIFPLQSLFEGIPIEDQDLLVATWLPHFLIAGREAIPADLDLSGAAAEIATWMPKFARPTGPAE